jgi:glycosyltransferase involved in cell wall biosynthesis
LKVALVHEWLTTLGGSERVVWAFHRLFPGAPVYTSVHRKDLLPAAFHELDIRPSFLQRIPGATRHYQKLLPLMPLAFEQFDLSGYDVVLSSHHACAKGVITSPDTLHISYVHTPMRYAWDLFHPYQQSMSPLMRPLAAMLLSQLRQWDVLSANRVDYFLANSKEVARRIQKHYRRPAHVIHPPIDTGLYERSEEVGDHYLVVSRFVPYKRVDLAIQAANRLGIPLKVIGSGPLEPELRRLATSKQITFMGHLSDEQVRQEMARCRALLFCSFEDFGLVPLEVQAAGRPVIAYGAGGALETVIDGVTGAFFQEQTVDSLCQTIRRFETLDLDPAVIQRHARSFDFEAFAEQLMAFVTQAYQAHRQGEVLPSLEVVHG